MWTVELVKGRFTIVTKTEPPGEGQRFDFQVAPTGVEAHKASSRTMRGVPPSNETKLRKGLWSVDVADLPDGWKVKSSLCTESDTTTLSIAAGSGATLGVEPDDRVRCTFTFRLLAPKAGRWRAENGAGLVSCGAFNQRLPAVVDFGKITVRGGGDRLIAKGLSDATWKLDRVRERPRRYSGSIKPPIPGGKGSFDVTLQLINEKRMEGSLTGTVRVGGTSCGFSRPLVLKYAGGK